MNFDPFQIEKIISVNFLIPPELKGGLSVQQDHF